MSTSVIVGEEIDKQAALASAALQNIAGVDASTNARELDPRAVLDMLGPYSVALYIAERVVQSAAFNADLAPALHSKLLPLERMVDDKLAAARRRVTSTTQIPPSRFIGSKPATSRLRIAWWRSSPCWTRCLTTSWQRQWRSTSAVKPFPWTRFVEWLATAFPYRRLPRSTSSDAMRRPVTGCGKSSKS